MQRSSGRGDVLFYNMLLNLEFVPLVACLLDLQLDWESTLEQALV